MAAIETLALDSGNADPWDSLAGRLAAWAGERGIPMRETVLLLPFAQLLGPARAAFAARGGFLPRIETTQTLAAALGPPPAAQSGQISFDPALDRITAARELARQPFGRDWRRRDRAGFEAAVAQAVTAAHALARTAAALAPAVRAAFWERGRETLGPRTGPGAAEQQLARVALEWAALMPEPATDRLFAHRSGAWAVVRAGGPDALADAVLQAADPAIPALRLDADAAARPGRPTIAICDDVEHEAQASAAQVLAHLAAGQVPVALVALDRGVVRRVHALLARQEVAVRDETGWKLSTTRAAATVMAALRAARRQASTDALFDWLKSAGATPGLDALETHCRSQGLRRVEMIDAASLPEGVRPVWADALAALRAFDDGTRRPLADGLVALGALLSANGAMADLRADDAGRQVLAALRLDDPAAAPAARLGDCAGAMVDGDDLRHWVDTLLEERVFKPYSDERDAAQVFIVPMARAILRPFAAVVCPGADSARLGAWPAPHPLLSDRQLGELGLPDAQSQRRTEAQVFAQLTAMPQVTFLRRREDEGQALEDSPLVERLLLAVGPAAAWHDPRTTRRLASAPVLPGEPSAGALLPGSLSASAVEALRACPYRFFALHLLRLKEADELDAEVEKRDYGTWLHAVLMRFHRDRRTDASPGQDLDALRAIAEAVQTEQRLPDDEFLPFSASFAHFAPRYVDWIRARDAEGARWLSGEREAQATPAPLAGMRLHGRIDRVDQVRAEQGGVQELIDYKTGSADRLRALVKEPFEDTQLAFYAALLQHDGAPLAARYLLLDDPKSPHAVEHPDVERSAEALVVGLGDELARIRAGAPLRPLGEGATCEHCEARGLCRRDHWAAP